jgi:glycosyltransferase involved in cell wall biosynthesis
MKKAIVSVTNDLVTDNRVDRTCNQLVDEGYEVILIGRKLRGSLPVPNRNYKCKRINLFFKKGPFFYAEYNVRLFIFLIFNKSNVLFSNDLDTLPANFLANKIKHGSILVYDTHELFTEVPELINRNKTRNFWLALEKFMFPKLDYVITVNQSIADIYYDRYKVPITVVRNIPNLLKEKKNCTKKALGLPEDQKIIIIQGAGLNVQRGIEEAVLAMHQINNSILIIVGNGDVIPKVKKMVISEGLNNKVYFFDKRPYAEMMEFTRISDLGLALDKPISDNYKYALPNKVFDYIQAGIPILCSDLIEIKNIVQKYNIGKSISMITPEEIAKNINSIFSDDALMNQMKLNCKYAAEIENWENEKLKLSFLLKKIDSKITE